MTILKHKIYIYPIRSFCPFDLEPTKVIAIDRFKTDFDNNTFVWIEHLERWENQNKFLKYPFSLN